MSKLGTCTQVKSHIWNSHVAHMTESDCTEGWVMSHIWMSHINESCCTHEHGTSHIWTSHVAHMNESRRTYERVRLRVGMSHVTCDMWHVTCDMSHVTWLTHMDDTGWLRLVGSLKLQVSFAEYSLFYRALLQKRPIILRSLLIVASPYTYGWFMSHVWSSPVAHIDKSCRTYH